MVPLFLGGPAFFGANNAHGAPTGALVFGAIGLLWTPIRLAFNKVQMTASLGECMRLFKRGDITEQQQDVEMVEMDDLGLAAAS